MGLRIEEDLDVTDVLVAGPRQIGHRQIEEVDLMKQDRRALVIEVEEVL